MSEDKNKIEVVTGSDTTKAIFNLNDEQEARLAKLSKRMGVSDEEALIFAIEVYKVFYDQMVALGMHPFDVSIKQKKDQDNG